MSRKVKPIKIASVSYTYVGDNEGFNQFLRTVIQKYLTENAEAPVPERIEKSA